MKQTVVITGAYHFCQLRKKKLSKTLVSRLTPYAEEINGDNEGGFQCNRPTTDHIFCICQILEGENTTKQSITSL